MVTPGQPPIDRKLYVEFEHPRFVPPDAPCQIQRGTAVTGVTPAALQGSSVSAPGTRGRTGRRHGPLLRPMPGSAHLCRACFAGVLDAPAAPPLLARTAAAHCRLRFDPRLVVAGSHPPPGRAL